MIQTTAVIVGAGHADLAMSRHLTERSIDHVVLERGQVANSWRTQRWPSLRLLTPNWQTRLPGYDYGGDDPDGFMPVTDVAATLTRCARFIGAPVRTSTTERSVRAMPQGFEIQANDDLLRAQAVVLATGACVLPATPAVADAPRPEPRAAADAIVLRQHRAVASSPFVLALVAFLPAVARGIVQRQPVPWPSLVRWQR